MHNNYPNSNNNSDYQFLKERIKELFLLTDSLKSKFPNREFTPDGRLVGDIGEIIGKIFYGISLYEKQKERHDGTYLGDKLVQIKATFKDQLTISKKPEYYLGFKIDRNGDFHEIFNGPGTIIYDFYSHRKTVQDEKLTSISLKRLKELQKLVPDNEKILRIS